MKIAVITPIAKRDYLTYTVLDGLVGLGVEHRLSNKEKRSSFVKYAREADLIFFCWGKTVKRWKLFDFANTDYKLAGEINCWHKTIFIDGNEVGRDGRALGLSVVPDKEMLSKCALYFKREKPYPDGVLALPFGITNKMIAWNPNVRKDVDFFCVFGKHDEYLPLRQKVTEEVKKFCAESNFTCVTERMEPAEFRQTLARSKIGVSVGGGGYDTLRFWEILANNCLLLTEEIDIYPDNGASELNYLRITEFNSLDDFRLQLQKVGEHLRTDYPPANLDAEYAQILLKHSSRARVQRIFDAAKSKGIIK